MSCIDGGLDVVSRRPRVHDYVVSWRCRATYICSVLAMDGVQAFVASRRAWRGSKNSGKTRKLDPGNKNASTFVSVHLSQKKNHFFVKHIEKYDNSKSRRNSSQSNIDWLRFPL